MPSQSFVNSRGQSLKSYQYLPQTGAVRAVVHYHHGLGDYAQRNEPLFATLNAAGVAVFAMDVHGHGFSEPLERTGRFAIREFAHVVDDAQLHVDSVVRPFIAERCPGTPLFLMGSSMGAAAGVAGLILNATAADAKRTLGQKLQEPLVPIARWLVPFLEIVPTQGPEKFVRDPEELQRRAADMTLNKGGLKVCTACSMLDAFAEIRRAEAQLAAPVLAIHGARDEVCPPEHVERLLANCASADKTFKLYADALHDTLHDYGKEEVMQVIVDWVCTRSR